MGITLGAAKMKLEQDLKKAFKDAAFDAFMTQHEPNSLQEASKYDNENKAMMEKKANEFAKTLSDSLAKDLATAIHDFVKEIGIQINTIPPTVMSLSGPCTGMIPMTSFTVM